MIKSKDSYNPNVKNKEMINNRSKKQSRKEDSCL